MSSAALRGGLPPPRGSAGASADRRRIAPPLRVAWGLALAGAGLLFCFFVSGLPGFVGAQMNADSLLALSFVWDLQHHDYAWDNFQLARVPSLFPDLAIQTLARLAIPSDGWALFAYACIQFAVFVLAAADLARLLTGRPFLETATVSLLVIALAVLADACLPGGTGNTFAYFISCIHFGPFAASLIALAAACRLLTRWGHANALLFFAVSTLSILSDKLLLVSFALPAALAALATGFVSPARVRRRAWGIAGIVAVAVLAAREIDRTLYRQPDVSIRLVETAPRLKTFLLELGTFLSDHALVLAICPGLPLAVFLACPALLGARPRAADVGRARSFHPRFLLAFLEQRLGAAGAFLWLASALAMAGVVLATALLAYADPGSYRYVAPAFSLALVFTVAAICRAASLRMLFYAACAPLMFFVSLGATRAGDGKPGSVTWRSPLADCLTENGQRWGLGAGVAEYWQSRPLMVASGWRLQVNQANHEGQAYVWGNDPYWYTKSFTAPETRPVYNFVVMQDMHPEGVTARYGPPSAVHACEGGPPIWVYADAERFTQSFIGEFAPPAGSYRETCSDAMQVWDRLSARCRTGGGASRWTTLNSSRCVGDIFNENGRLACVKRR